MAKKSKKHEDLPEGMSRRQAKLAKRAAERAALEKDPRPFAGLACEADLIALQMFVPSATATIDLTGIDRPVTLVTVLPGASAALVRDEAFGGNALVALQVQAHSQNPGRDLAYALAWASTAKPGESLGSTAADGTQPSISELIPADAQLTITEHDDFNWWLPEGQEVNPQWVSGLQQANKSILPSRRVVSELPGSIWWVNPGGGKAHIRWVRTEDDEQRMLTALARIAARGELNLGEGSKFAGVFRTHGVVVPVFDLDPARAHDSYGEELALIDAALTTEYANDAQLTSDERRQLENIKSRQVTIS